VHLIYCRERRDTLGTAIALFNLGIALRHQEEIGGLTLFVAAEEILARLSNQHVERVRADIASWRRNWAARRGKRWISCVVISKRRPLGYLRDIAAPEPEIRPLSATPNRIELNF